VWEAITSTADTGASAIISYHSEIDDRLGGGFIEIAGFSSDDDALTQTINGLTAGQPYDFRVSAKNAIGWGALSSVVEIIPSAVPGITPTVTVTNLGANIKIAWTDADDKGSSITKY